MIDTIAHLCVLVGSLGVLALGLCDGEREFTVTGHTTWLDGSRIPFQAVVNIKCPWFAWLPTFRAHMEREILHAARIAGNRAPLHNIGHLETFENVFVRKLTRALETGWCAGLHVTLPSRPFISLDYTAWTVPKVVVAELEEITANRLRHAEAKRRPPQTQTNGGATWLRYTERDDRTA